MSKYKSEEDRIKAIEALDPNGDDYDAKFNEIDTAEIGEDATPTPVVIPDESVAKTPPATDSGEQKPPAQSVGDIFTVNRGELPEGYGSVNEVLKAFKEQRALIARQQEKFQELLNKPQEPLHPEYRELPPQPKTEPKVPVNFSALREGIKKVDNLQAELDKMVEDDEDSVHTTEYRKKEREMFRLNRDINNSLAEQTAAAYSVAEEARSTAAGHLKKLSDQKVEEERKGAVDSLYREIDSIDIPEYKMSKSVVDVERDFKEYRRKIALAYYGRPANSTDEETVALEQAKFKNPKLVASCQIVGASIEPSEDVKRYLEHCSVLDFRAGALDPVTGKECAPLTMYDQKRNAHVPIPIKDAIEAYRIRIGYYVQRADNAYQKGAEAAATAAMRRDVGAVELGVNDQTGTSQTPEWAEGVVSNVNVDKMMYEADHGNRGKLEEYNRACKIIGMPEL